MDRFGEAVGLLIAGLLGSVFIGLAIIGGLTLLLTDTCTFK